MDTIWTEKYRPARLRDMVGQKPIVERLEAMVRSGSITHMLFCGPAGVGKTTAAVCVAKEMFKNNWQARFSETNASDERGIDVVRTKIKTFAAYSPMIGDNDTSRFKIIFLDECDALTRDAQNALRRTIEKNSTTCRFILSCNYINKIIDPIQSRCAVFRFLPLKAEDVERYLQRIVSDEKLKMEEKTMEALIEVAEGDLRAATNILQAAAASASEGGKIAAKSIYSAALSATPAEAAEILRLAAVDGDFPAAREKMLHMINKGGLGGEEVLKALYREVYKMEIAPRKQMAIIRALAEYSFRIMEGANERIQLDAFLAEACALCGGDGEGKA